MAEPAESPSRGVRAPRSRPRPRTAPVRDSNAGDAQPAARGLRDHAETVRRQALVIGVSVVAAVLIALVASLMQPTKYQATTDVLVPPQLPATGDAAQQVLAQRAFDPNRAMQDEARIAVAATIVDEVRARRGEGSFSLTAKAVKDADVLQITATADTAERAQAAADTAGAIYLERHNATVPAGTASAVVLQPAPLPSSPSQPTIARNLVLALIAGLLFGVALAYAVDAFADE